MVDVQVSVSNSFVDQSLPDFAERIKFAMGARGVLGVFRYLLIVTFRFVGTAVRRTVGGSNLSRSLQA